MNLKRNSASNNPHPYNVIMENRIERIEFDLFVEEKVKEIQDIPEEVNGPVFRETVRSAIKQAVMYGATKWTPYDRNTV